MRRNDITVESVSRIWRASAISFSIGRPSNKKSSWIGKTYLIDSGSNDTAASRLSKNPAFAVGSCRIVIPFGIGSKRSGASVAI